MRRDTAVRPRVMGILNVTPDSFSDGGRWTSVDDAVAHAVRLAGEGADIIDVGGESTRPGAVRVAPAEEQRRVLPIVHELVDRGIVVSVDTLNASTATAAALAGAAIINDVSGGLSDPAMYAAVADLDVDFVVSHWRGHSDTMNDFANYTDVVAEVRDALDRRVADSVSAGIRRDRVIVDPGLGFAKTGEHNWRLLARLDVLATVGPVLIGASRKRFLGELLPAGAPTADRDPATAAISVLAAQAGVWGVRVHNVAATTSALGVLDVWRERALA